MTEHTCCFGFCIFFIIVIIIIFIFFQAKGVEFEVQNLKKNCCNNISLLKLPSCAKPGVVHTHTQTKTKILLFVS